MSKKKAIVVGAGIVGLATARALAIKGFAVTVFERGAKATGASVRNFGMVWPIGQTPGKQYGRATRSRDIWREIGKTGALWYENAGSLHVAYAKDEMNALEEIYTALKEERNLRLLSAEDVKAISHATVPQGLVGGLHSDDEVIVDPREAIAALPAFLTEKYGVEFIWNTCVVSATTSQIVTGANQKYPADIVFVCSGADFETLYPQVFIDQQLTKCKLQMMRFVPQSENWRIGPALCGALSLIHYKSFEVAPSLQLLKKRFENELPEYLKWGIHVMVSQNGNGELTVGDSHEYGLALDPFDRDFINRLILDYLKKFAQFKDPVLSESWNGTYAKSTTGQTEVFLSPEPGVYILNAVGGAGMTLSFGLAEELVESI